MSRFRVGDTVIHAFCDDYDSDQVPDYFGVTGVVTDVHNDPTYNGLVPALAEVTIRRHDNGESFGAIDYEFELVQRAPTTPPDDDWFNNVEKWGNELDDKNDWVEIFPSEAWVMPLTPNPLEDWEKQLLKVSGMHEVDMVNHPPHYAANPNGVECIDVTEYMNFNLGNAVKYVWRTDEKGDPIENLNKARFYLDREIDRRKRQEISTATATG